MRDQPLNVVTKDGAREGTLILELHGPLTLNNMFGFQEQVRAMTNPVTLFELSDCTYMDSAGLGVLMNFYVSAERHGRKMGLVAVNDRIMALLELTHIAPLLKCFPTVEAAEAAL